MHHLTTEEALVKLKSTSSPSDKKKAEIKNYQTPIEGIPVVPAEKSYSKAASLHKNVFNTVIFTDSIPKGMQMQKFNHLIKQKCLTFQVHILLVITLLGCSLK